MPSKQDTFEEIKEQAKELQSGFIDRSTTFDEMEEIYFMEPAEEAAMKRGGEEVKVTLSPDGRNACKGAVNLICASKPAWNIPWGDGEAVSEDVAETLEMISENMWDASGKVIGDALHFDAALSLFLYGELHLPIRSMTEIGKLLPKDANVQRISKRTPYMFDVWSPRECFPRFNQFGLDAHLRRVETKARNVIAAWGSTADKALDGKTGNDAVILNEWMDQEWQSVYLDGNADNPIVLKKHGLPSIPIVVVYSEGSQRLFGEWKKQVQPFLYALNKSGLWKRQNLSLTVLYTLLFAIGSNPIWLYKKSSADKHLDADYSVPGGVWEIENNEELTQLMLKSFPPELLQGLEIASQKISESTIYPQALGEALGKNAAASMVLLLQQAGRIPLVLPQKRLSWAFGRAMEIAFAWWKHEKPKFKGTYAGKMLKLKPADIPDDLEVEATLEISMPVDRLQDARTGDMLVDKGLVSREWLRNTVLHIGQSRKMDNKIIQEQVIQLRGKAYIEREMQKLEIAAEGGQMAVEIAKLLEGVPPEAREQLMMMIQQMVMPPQEQQGGEMVPGEEGMIPEGMEGPPPGMEEVAPGMSMEEGIPPGMPPEGMQGAPPGMPPQGEPPVGY